MRKTIYLLVILLEAAAILWTASVAFASSPEPPGGAVWEPTPWRSVPYTLCAPAVVYGSPRTTATPLYTLPKGATVIPHEWRTEWVMFQAARWIQISSLCEKQP